MCGASGTYGLEVEVGVCEKCVAVCACGTCVYLRACGSEREHQVSVAGANVMFERSALFM